MCSLIKLQMRTVDSAAVEDGPVVSSVVSRTAAVVCGSSGTTIDEVRSGIAVSAVALVGRASVIAAASVGVGASSAEVVTA